LKVKSVLRETKCKQQQNQVNNLKKQAKKKWYADQPKGWVSEWVSESVSEWALATTQPFSAISWREQVNIQWENDEVRFVQGQHA
jgi:hypothetical protein